MTWSWPGAKRVQWKLHTQKGICGGLRELEVGALWCGGMDVHRGRRGRQQVGHGGLVEHSMSLNYYIGDDGPPEDLVQGMTRLGGKKKS